MEDLKPVKLLTGHVSDETAYMVDDYPYGRELRCKIRYWVETAAKGAKKGQQRFVSQTTNPKRGHMWNKPHPAQYYGMVFLYLNEIDHVKWTAIDPYNGPEGFTRMRMMNIPDQLSGSERGTYDVLLSVSRRMNKTTWKEWDDRTRLIANHIRDTGDVPTLENNVWASPVGRMYLSSPDVCFWAARELLSGE